ncbi:MAG: ABC-2 family transporter protein [Bdellovibrionales bacterium]|nr:ABC-2 family transporter protein [Bdellovibrionales bacterium]
MSTTAISNPAGSSKLAWQVEWRFAAIRNGMRDALAYRGDFIINFLSSALVPVAIQLILWYSIFTASGKTEFAGMTYPELLAYTWTSLLFSQIRGGNYDFDLIEMIRTGNLSTYLVRPVGVVAFTFFRGFGEKLATTGLCFLLGIIAIYFTQYHIHHFIMGMMMALLGNVIAYLFSSTLSASAFYWENAFAVLMVKNMFVSLFSGELIPLSIVPEQYAWVWKSTPFYLFVYGPTQVALGKWDTQIWANNMLIGFAWLTVFWITLEASWRYSIKRYQGLGG